jgi:hypothetical protein
LDRNYRRIATTEAEPLWPYTWKDRRFQWSEEVVYRTRMELLVALMAHEAYHATGGNRDVFRSSKGRIARADMEFQCNRFAMKTVEALRQEWPVLRSKIYRAMRQEREKKRSLGIRRRDPVGKLQHAMDQLSNWQRRRKLAETKIRKYRRRIAYYRRLVAPTDQAQERTDTHA